MNAPARPLSAPAALRRLVLPLVIVATAVALAEPVPLNNGNIVNGDVSNVTARGFDVKLPYGAAKYSWSQIDLRRLPSVNPRLFQSYCVATGYQPPAAPAPVARPAVAPPTAAPAAAPQAATALPAEWPCFRGPNHDGKSPDKGLLKQWPEDGPPLLLSLIHI